MKKIGIAAVITTVMVSLMAFKSVEPKTEEAKIQWVTLEEAYKLNQKQPRKIWIDLYTEWCGWCKVMDKNTFKNAEVVQFTNKKFYAVKYNPEKDADVMFGKVSFRSLINGTSSNRLLVIWSRVCSTKCSHILATIITKKSLLTSFNKRLTLLNTPLKHNNGVF